MSLRKCFLRCLGIMYKIGITHFVSLSRYNYYDNYFPEIRLCRRREHSISSTHFEMELYENRSFRGYLDWSNTFSLEAKFEVGDGSEICMYTRYHISSIKCCQVPPQAYLKAYERPGLLATLMKNKYILIS